MQLKNAFHEKTNDVTTWGSMNPILLKYKVNQYKLDLQEE
jgi:hypothetical protein